MVIRFNICKIGLICLLIPVVVIMLISFSLWRLKTFVFEFKGESCTNKI